MGFLTERYENYETLLWIRMRTIVGSKKMGKWFFANCDFVEYDKRAEWYICRILMWNTCIWLGNTRKLKVIHLLTKQFVSLLLNFIETKILSSSRAYFP